MALEGLRKVLKRINEIRRGFYSLSHFSRGIQKEGENSKPYLFRDLFLKEVKEARKRDQPVRAEQKERSSSSHLSLCLESPRLSSSRFHERSVSRSPSIKEVVEKASRIYDIDPDLIMAVIQAESGFNPRAVSSKGAMGLMQLMPATARELGVSDPFDIEDNIMGGVKYLRYLSEKYKGNLELILAAYNAGPYAVDRYRGIPPYRETQNYVQRVLSIYRRRKLKR